MTLKKPLYIPYAGQALITTPLLNKSSAFTKKERVRFNLMGLLPPVYETIEEQVLRCYWQYSRFDNDMDKHIYLRAIQDKNETLFFRLIQDHIKEMLPIIYTPTVGDACMYFSDIYRTNRGVFISYENRDYIDDILQNATKRNVKVIVVTDGERVLGLGDQGVGGMGISIGKLSLYTACGGISPAYTLPVMLDVGTNNENLLNDPMYMGTRHYRIGQEEYAHFIEMFISAVKRRWPNVLLQFEDFAQPNAMPLLQKYKDEVCCFNDDIQGTASVTAGTLLAACRVKKESITQQKIVFLGGGSAGCGIAEQIIRQMIKEGLSDEEARSKIYMIDRAGLMNTAMEGLRDFQMNLAQDPSLFKTWRVESENPSLLDVIKNVKPQILIGVSGVPGLFTQEVVEAMSSHCEHPIIFPLSNPTRQIEATPEQVITWSDGKAIVATGSPFEPVSYKGKTYSITQCNNSYIFPGLGLGVIAVKSKRVSDEMMTVASETLALTSPLASTGEGDLLPDITLIPEVSQKIAFAVGKMAIAQGLALEISDEELQARIEKSFWRPIYREYKRASF